MEDFLAKYFSPIGWITLSGNDEGLISLKFEDTMPDDKPLLTPMADECIRQLDEYFKGKRKSFDFRYQLQGTGFQKKVWDEILKISYGHTSSYLAIAKAVGDKMSVRAVGNANAKNPLALVVPCHRIIGNHGDLVGYGGGIWRKRWLLDFESNQLHF